MIKFLLCWLMGHDYVRRTKIQRLSRLCFERTLWWECVRCRKAMPISHHLTEVNTTWDPEHNNG